MLDTRLPITKQTPRDVVQNRHGGAPFAHDGSYELPLGKPRLDRSGRPGASSASSVSRAPAEAK